MTESMATLNEIHRLQRRTRSRAHRGAWLPALATAVLVLGSTVLYTAPFSQPSELRAEYPYWAGLADMQRGSTLSYAYWFGGVAVLVAVTALWYRWRERRTGLRVAWVPFTVTAAAVLLLVAAVAAAPGQSTANELRGDWSSIWLPGLVTPLLPVAAAVVVLGFVERSRWLVASGLWLGLLTAWDATTMYLLTHSVRPGHLLVLMAAPLLGFAAVQAGRADP